MKYVIEQAKVEETEEIDRMLTSLIQDERENYDNNINKDYQVKNFYEKLINNENACILVAKCDKIIIGYVYGFIQDNGQVFDKKIAQLDAIFVKKEYRGNGIAQSLIQELTKWAKEQRATYIELSVCQENEKALQLYKNDGFQEEKIIMKKKIDISNI